MLLRHCIALWLCGAAVQGVGVYLMYVVRNHYRTANAGSNLDENMNLDFLNVPRPISPGPFGTLYFPPIEESNGNRLGKYVAPSDDGQAEDSTPPSHPSLLSILTSGPVGLYLLCSFIPLISLCIVVLFIVCMGKEPSIHSRNRPAILEAGIHYEQLEPPMRQPRRRRFPCRHFG